MIDYSVLMLVQVIELVPIILVWCFVFDFIGSLFFSKK